MASFSHYRVYNENQLPVMAGTTEPHHSEQNFLADLSDNLQLRIVSLTEESIVFDLIGVDASIANALRRILLAEVPTVAIETIYIENNTSIIQDEVLSHRLGLVPIKVDPNDFEDFNEEDGATDLNTVVFKLDAVCVDERTDAEIAAEGPTYTKNVLSGDFEWIPQGNQSEKFPDGIAPVHSDIVLAKLRPGQRISLEAHCRKGIGKDHTKFSPSATASYRLLPDISFENPVTGKLAEELRDMCPLQVFDIEDIGGLPTAVAARPRDCTMCRECIRREGWTEGRVKLRRVADHFIFTVESSGCIPPVQIVREAIGVLRAKAVKFQQLVEEHIGS